MNRVEVLKSEIHDRLCELRMLLEEEIRNGEGLENYALYHGNELIRVGTLKELSKYTKFSEGTLKNYSYPSHIKKTEGTNAPRVMKVINP